MNIFFQKCLTSTEYTFLLISNPVFGLSLKLIWGFPNMRLKKCTCKVSYPCFTDLKWSDGNKFLSLKNETFRQIPLTCHLLWKLAKFSCVCNFQRFKSYKPFFIKITELKPEPGLFLISNLKT